jgi:hypothetical protein
MSWRANKTVIDGITFASAGEAGRYAELRLLQSAGVISELECHPEFVLQEGFKDEWSGKRERAIKYTGDFKYIEDGHYVVEDFKGDRVSRDFTVRWRLVKHQNPGIEFRIVEA